MKKSNAFSLIEVLISIIILSIVGVGLFQISSNNKQNFSILSEKGSFDTLASIPLLHNSKNLHNKDKNIYEFLRRDYNISDDDFRKVLKEIKIHYSHEEFSTIKPFESDNEESSVEEENNETQNMFFITIDKVDINDKKQSTSAFTISIQK